MNSFVARMRGRLRSTSGIAPVAVLCALSVAVCAHSSSAETFNCPVGIGYRFAYSEVDLGPIEDPGWAASIKRAKGRSATGLPRLSIRKDTMRCRYQLPNGAFATVDLPFPEGVSTCVIAQDDYFELAYFRCE